MSTIQERLLSAEDQFLRSILTGEDAVEAFNLNWDTLIQDVDSALETNSLDAETCQLVHTTALRIAALADTSASLFTKCDELTATFMGEIDCLVSQLIVRDRGDFPQPESLPSASGTHHLPSSFSHRSGSTKRARPECAASTSSKRRKCSPVRPISKLTECSDLSVQSPANLPGSAGELRAIGPLTLASPSRKRRRSESDLSVAPGPKRVHRGPRLHAVSDSFASTLKAPMYDKASATSSTLPGLEAVDSGQSKIQGGAHHSSIIIEPLDLTISDSPPCTMASPLDSDELDKLLQSLQQHTMPSIPSSVSSLPLSYESSEWYPTNPPPYTPDGSSASTSPCPSSPALLASPPPSSSQHDPNVDVKITHCLSTSPCDSLLSLDSNIHFPSDGRLGNCWFDTYAPMRHIEFPDTPLDWSSLSSFFDVSDLSAVSDAPHSPLLTSIDDLSRSCRTTTHANIMNTFAANVP